MRLLRWTREQTSLVFLSAMLLVSLGYYGAVTLAHRHTRFAAPLFSIKRSSPDQVHVSTMICHGVSRYWAVRVKDGKTVGDE